MKKDSCVQVGVVGCGKISGIYLKNLTQVFRNAKITACADLDRSRADEAAAQYPGVRAMTVDELMADPGIEIVLNLTVPKAHYEVALRALESGKSVHNEKPLTLTRDEARTLLALARKKRLRVGSAPDTFMGAGIQTCIKLVEEGAIGQPVSAAAFMLCRGHESWHPDPEFYYEVGGGPMFDMGPYYLTAMVAIMGPVRRVTGATRITFPQRTITSEKKRGKVVQVEVPTHVAGIMDFANGAIGTIVTSFDVWNNHMPRIEVYGSEGTLLVPDPNGFGGPVMMWKPGDKDWQDMPLSHGYAENSRGIGVADMAAAIRSKRAHRANGAMAAHVLDIMHAVHESSDRGKHVTLKSKCDRPAPMPTGLAAGELDA